MAGVVWNIRVHESMNSMNKVAKNNPRHRFSCKQLDELLNKTCRISKVSCGSVGHCFCGIGRFVLPLAGWHWHCLVIIQLSKSTSQHFEGLYVEESSTNWFALV